MSASAFAEHRLLATGADLGHLQPLLGNGRGGSGSSKVGGKGGKGGKGGSKGGSKGGGKSGGKSGGKGGGKGGSKGGNKGKGGRRSWSDVLMGGAAGGRL